MTPIRHCPALMISAIASGQGKTTVTAALATLHRRAGRRVRVFKTGPDFLDPTLLARASGAPVQQLDLFMGGEAHCQQLLYEAAAEADIILVEGVMGLYDGTPSSADLAERFGLPILALIDAAAMAQTFGAIAFGLSQFRPSLDFSGVIANRVGSPGHAKLLQDSLPEGLDWYGALSKSEEMVLPSRHLGLVQANELTDLEDRLQVAADAIAQTAAVEVPPPVAFSPPQGELPLVPNKALAGVRIAVAQDLSFSFIYPANLALLEQMGAVLETFSPIAGETLPSGCDSVYLPGGYPELHLQALSNNRRLIDDLHRHHRENRPIVAECGGLLYLLERLSNLQGESAELCGLIPGHAAQQARLVNLGLHTVDLPEGRLRGHSFHHTHSEISQTPSGHTEPQRKTGRPEAVYRSRRLIAGYMHAYWPSNPSAVAKLFHPNPQVTLYD